MFLDQLIGRMAEQLVLQRLDHRLSPTRRGDEEALEKIISPLGRKVLVEVGEFPQGKTLFDFNVRRFRPAFLDSRLVVRRPSPRAVPRPN
jgi:hypothetical protein